MKLKLSQDYVLCKFYTYGEDDTFDYFYWRNNILFRKNSFYEHVNIENYDNEEYPEIEIELKNAKMIKNNCFILPKGEHELSILDDGYWELDINGVVLTDIVNLLDEETWSFDPIRKSIMSIVEL